MIAERKFGRPSHYANGFLFRKRLLVSLEGRICCPCCSYVCLVYDLRCLRDGRGKLRLMWCCEEEGDGLQTENTAFLIIEINIVVLSASEGSINKEPKTLRIRRF